MWPRACLIFVCLAFGGVAPASAACTQGNLRGLWDVYAAGAEVEAFWVRCVIRIQANGVVVPGTRCFYDTGEQTVINSGRLSLVPSCRVVGHLVEQAGSQLFQSILRQATLARDKNLLVGVGTGPTGSIFLFNAVRR